eukprot:m.874471 g.874471  ORF g.874471 m.874471 type:complete len:75 (+) comp23576_c0_seq1:70-294(+)
MSSATTMDPNIQSDWANREFIEQISKGIKNISSFLNEFDMSTRFRMAKLNEKLSSLERSLDHIEAKLTKGDSSG